MFYLSAIPNLVDLAMVGRLSVTELLGREDIEDARCRGWNAMLFSGALGRFMGLCVIVFGKPILALFLTDPATLEVAYVPMLITGAIIWVRSGVDTGGNRSSLTFHRRLGTAYLHFLNIILIRGRMLETALQRPADRESPMSETILNEEPDR